VCAFATQLRLATEFGEAQRKSPLPPPRTGRRGPGWGAGGSGRCFPLANCCTYFSDLSCHYFGEEYESSDTQRVDYHDACVLYSSSCVISWFAWRFTAGAGAVHRQRPEPPQALRRTRQLMDRHVRGFRVRGYQRWEQRLTLPEANGRHVLAAALACVADVIVTFNTADFPPAGREKVPRPLLAKRVLAPTYPL